MKFDIANLARENPFTPKLKIVSTRMSNGNKLQIFCLGLPWWKSADPNSGHQAMTLVFDNAIKYNLDLSVLGGSSMFQPKWKIQCTRNIDWAESSGSQIYCASPIPHPSSVLMAIEAALVADGSPLNPLDCVSGSPAGTFSGFLSLANQENFLLSDAPTKSVFKAICDQLKAQKVEHNILPSQGTSLPDLFVEVGNCKFFCDGGKVVVRETPAKRNRTLSDQSPPPVAVSA